MVAERNNDQIIGVALKKSLLVIACVSAITVLALLIRNVTGKSDDVSVAEPISPKASIASDVAVPKVKFTDITAQSGITHSHVNGAYGERLLPETMGGGVAVLDFNNDEIADLLFVSGRSWPWKESENQQSSLVLYKGRGDGTFLDVTLSMSLHSSMYGMGAAVGDYDNDGFVDIFVSSVGKNTLYRNIGGARFEDVTSVAGVAGAAEQWSTSSGFFDYDRDGDLDLMVLNYVRWSRDIDLQANYQLTGIGRAYGPPAQFAGTNSYFYRNNGDGTFEEISADIGIHVNNAASNRPVGKGLGMLPIDVDADGWLDVVVANDMVRNFLFKNVGGQYFEEVGIDSGVAFDNTGMATGAMGIDGKVFSDSGEQAIAIGNFGNEMTSLYMQPPQSSLFTDQAIVTGVGPASRRAVTFGLLFLDYDLDGRADLLQANGHIEPQINIVEPALDYAQVPQLFWNCGIDCSRQFTPVSFDDDNDLSNPLVGRAAAYVDIDNDGDLDLVLTQIAAPARLLRNDQQTNHNWLQLDLVNETGSPAIGATAQVTMSGETHFSQVMPTRSYLSQVEPILTFGLGSATEVESIRITWGDNRVTTIDRPEINKRHKIVL